jgi:DNA-binding MltR family transcriptional regulator
MPKRDALRELGRKLPAPRDIDRIMDGLRDKDDLHTGIIGVSIVEATLERLIVTRLKRTDKEFLNRLFQNMGPLSDFNSKILIGEAFGILTRPLADELHVMRAIRNAFAHAKMHISFSDVPISQEISRLRLIRSIQETNTTFPDGTPLKFNLPGKTNFLLAIRIVLIIMDEIGKKKSTADKVIARALKRPS